MGKEFRKMERLTGEYTRWNCACRHRLFFDVYEIADRLAIIEDILGDDYDLDRLRELVQAGREGRGKTHGRKRALRRRGTAVLERRTEGNEK